MSYILTCDNCVCSNLKFIEQNGELLTKGTGRMRKGAIALQTFDDRDDMRITLADAANVYGGLAKRILLPGNQNYLCHFDFNDAERNSKRKLLKIQVQKHSGNFIHMLLCLDYSDHTGTCYLLPNADELKKWAKKLNINTYEELNKAGELISVRSIGEL